MLVSIIARMAAPRNELMGRIGENYAKVSGMEKEPQSKPLFPMRINKYLAYKQIATRREADRLIEAGMIQINGKKAVLGDKVAETDTVEADPSVAKRAYIYLAYNKPVGIVTSAPQNGEKGIEQSIKVPSRVFPIGRLDKESRGLIILTDDGRITERLLSPEFDHEKEYIVAVNKPILQSFITRMGKGVKIGDYITKKCRVEQIDETHFKIVLTEGKKHQIRRMCTECGYEVADLERVRIMNIRLGNLGSGMFRPLKGEELAGFLRSLGF